MKLDPKKLKHKKALKALNEAVQRLGGTNAASKALKCNQGLISYYCNGRDGNYAFLPFDKALKISYYTGYKISLEDLLPEYDFRFLDSYIEHISEKND